MNLIIQKFFIELFIKDSNLLYELITFAWKANRLAFASFLHLVLLQDLSGISGNWEQKNILQTIEQLKQFIYLLL